MFAEMDDAFPNSIHTVDALRTLYKQPSALVSGKKKPQLDELSAKFVRASPFLLLGTASGEGELEVSPRGGPVGWVKVLDDTRLLIPDLNGNNLVDSMTNILANPYVSLLFVHPGKDETLRANGRACITIDEGLLGLCVEPTADGRAPKLPKAAIGVHIIDVFIHCAKAFRRGGVWNPESGPHWTMWMRWTSCAASYRSIYPKNRSSRVLNWLMPKSFLRIGKARPKSCHTRRSVWSDPCRARPIFLNRFNLLNPCAAN